MFNTSALAVGSHSITAIYNGDGNYSGSTPTVVTETIQDGPSSSGGLDGSGGGDGGATGGGGGEADLSSLDGAGGELFDDQVYSDAGITVPSNPAVAAAASNLSASAPAPSSSTAAAPPQGPLDASSSNVSTSSSSYQKHYTEWGSNSSASYYLDVAINSTFSNNQQSGTVTYTAMLEINGVMVYSYRNVVANYSNSPGVGVGNLPAYGEISNYSLLVFGMNAFT